MTDVPAYVSIVFILTTFASVAFLLQAVKPTGLDKFPSRLLIFILPLGLLFYAVLATDGFYHTTDTVPPRLILFGVLPSVLLVIAYVTVFGSFSDRLALRVLTMLHVIRIPVEIVLYWLFLGGLVPQMMTFEGRNFDILSGILAPIVYFAAFRGGALNKWLLIAYNILGLLLLANIVSIAAMSLPSPIQQLNFDQPNRGVLLFPYIWLPTIVVPIVLYSHLAALRQLVMRRT